MGAEVLLLAGAGLAAGASVMQGYQQNQIAKANARLAEQDAVAERSAAAVRADQIRKAAERQRGKTVGAVAASGVRIGEGSAADAESYVTQTGEYDALSEIISGNYRGRRLENEAAISRQVGRNAVTSGWLDAGASVLYNYGRAKMGGWGGKSSVPSSGRVNTSW